ncbi:MAG: hypothetical protein LBK56_03655, partial [Gracilibacteraceae bacterium]|nr:hypothetical protein [Gracilibacteraceae bacterium]
MRKQQQWQILDLLQTIEEAQAAGLYADCQDGALGIIRYVESLEGEGTRTAELLAEYYELLFRADGGEIGAEVLREHLRAIGAGVRSELRPNKIEAVFLSYNASMADCLESVYLAAKADPACEAVWLPIPYFERNNDGSLGAARYEGAESYGVSFACADWRGYDMKTRRPDAIFSFAPYDADNYVTAVHPDFYFERLRGLTDCLAYIPYFVCTGDVPEHFCTVAGCVYAHKVFVQSEKVRATYIRVFREAFGD